jgi:hypothetical protein
MASALAISNRINDGERAGDLQPDHGDRAG